MWKFVHLLEYNDQPMNYHSDWPDISTQFNMASIKNDYFNFLFYLATSLASTISLSDSGQSPSWVVCMLSKSNKQNVLWSLNKILQISASEA